MRCPLDEDDLQKLAVKMGREWWTEEEVLFMLGGIMGMSHQKWMLLLTPAWMRQEYGPVMCKLAELEDYGMLEWIPNRYRGEGVLRLCIGVAPSGEEGSEAEGGTGINQRSCDGNVCSAATVPDADDYGSGRLAGHGATSASTAHV